MMHIIDATAAQAVAAGGGIQIANAVRVCLAAAFTFLVMRQVMPMASGLASGIALSTYGIVSNALQGLGARNRQRITDFGRGAFLDRETTRWDPIARRVGAKLSGKLRAAWRRDNSIKP